MKRRTFIVAAAALGLAIAIPFLYKRYRISRWENLPPLIHPLVLSHFLEEEAIRKIGTAYRSLVPAEDSEKQLLRVLSPGDKSENPTQAENSVEGQMLEKKIEQEFRAENVTIINGWVLSVTEARQCALLSFS
ncbi:MAG: hypothetical protein Q8918_12925 [Bacteroidota bacterium]|nr:hypothetical protein [Bacteroidota bacterium]MDP4212580.1 hypothetical protein [Bacteroidota bacterium]MDP4251005.1 hypothetical protein [Bacteroidota bacterium]